MALGVQETLRPLELCISLKVVSDPLYSLRKQLVVCSTVIPSSCTRPKNAHGTVPNKDDLKEMIWLWAFKIISSKPYIILYQLISNLM